MANPEDAALGPVFQELNVTDELVLGFRFAVFFFAGGVAPNPMDIRFQRVSGIGAEVQTQPLVEGGQNLYAHRLPQRIEYQNLVLERGMVIGSPVLAEVNTALSLFKFAPSNLMVMLFSEERVPLAAWLFIRAYPVRWSTSDLEASEGRVVIDTLELAYARMQTLRI